MSDDTLFDQLADEFVQEVQQGKLPDIKEYALKHPELASRIRELFPTLLLVQGMAAAGHSESAKSVNQTGLSKGSIFGQYRIEGEIGRGGMGIVYKAIHVLLEKQVALKILPVRPTMNAEHLERFFREAKTAAGLHHTNIVPVFDVGQVSGTPYYAMEYIEGRSLETILRIIQSEIIPGDKVVSSSDSTFNKNSKTQFSTGNAVSSDRQKNRTGHSFANPSLRKSAGLPEKLEDYFRWIARVGIQAAEGLAHAHERKVIHRDIKPSNLLIDEKGVLWITDFGLARRIEDPAVTQSGTLIGTPRYMSPEQAESTRRPLDQRTDIYSLGATLYELLTCRYVFEGRTPHEVIFQIITRDPAVPRRLNKEIPEDLSTIVMKAMAKRPEDRYQSASLLVEDLNRWLRMEPIKARRMGPIGRMVRWCRRNPKLATVTAAAGIIILALSGIFYAGLMKENAKAKAALEHEKEARATLAMNKYAANLSAADSYLRSNSIDKAELSLSECSSSLRGWEWRHLKLRLNPELAKVQLDYVPRQLKLSSDGSKVLWLSEEKNMVFAADIKSQETAPLQQYMTKDGKGITGPPYVISFSQDGELIARTLWRGESSRDYFSRQFNGSFQGVTNLETFINTQRKLQEIRENPLRNILEIAKDLNSRAISGFQFSLPVGRTTSSVIFNQDGTRFAAWSGDGKIQICDTNSGKKLLSLTGVTNVTVAGGKGRVGSDIKVALSSDGDLVAIGSVDGSVHVWSVPSGKSIAVFGDYNYRGFKDLPESITSLAFRKDAKQIVYSSPETVRLWDLPSNKLLWTLKINGMRSLAFSMDGTVIAAGVPNGNINLINATSKKTLATLSGHKESVTSVLFDVDGAKIISASLDKTIRFWDWNALSYVRIFADPKVEVESGIWNPDGKHIILNVANWESGFINRNLDVPDSRSVINWDAVSGETAYLSNKVSVSELAGSANSNIARMFDDQIQIQSFKADLQRLNSHCLAFSQNGNLGAFAANRTILIWERTSGRLLRIIPDPGKIPINWIEFSPDGNRLISAGGHQDLTTIKIWNVTSEKPPSILHGHTKEAIKASFSPDGSLVLSSSYDNTVRVWDSSTGNERFSIPCTDADAIFNQDGSQIYAGCSDGTLGVWDAKTGGLLNSSVSNTGLFHSLAFSPDQSRLIAGVDTTIRIWDASSLTPLLMIPAHDIAISSVAFSPDGSMILSVGLDGKAKVWKSERRN